ncbi:hypothetical protein [Bacteroides acidifaciens]|uniref:hypothetical protein n=1 Tax=Bacteroides acidifaciens TaxID=85831 RepID=UPI0025960F0E|nr:hypothetical protein [Bacteroides acidifaciens]
MGPELWSYGYQGCSPGSFLWHKYVRHETVAQYVEGIEWLKSNGFRIYGIVIDGMK